MPDRPPPPLRVRDLELRFGERTYVMGIVNVTPDSFSGDGLLERDLPAVEAAVAQATRMVEEGADIIDVGGESTRPGHEQVSAAHELERVAAVIGALRTHLNGVPISIDTSKPDVARAALEAGADIVNDVSATLTGATLATVAAAHGVPYILMHSRERAEYGDVTREVVEDLRLALQRAEGRGCDPATLIVDPGIGFGKTAQQNLGLLRDLAAFKTLGHAVLLGASRKSTIGKVLGTSVEDRLEGTLATTAIGIGAGVDIVRVHDVAANLRVARMSDAIIRGNWRDADDVPDTMSGPRG